MTSTVFLIGATGHVGDALLDELAPDHAAGRLIVKAGARSPRSRELIATKGVLAVDFDLDRPANFDAALQGADTVFLLRPYTLRQLMHGKLVTDAARRAGVKTIVDIGAFGRPDTPWPIIGWNFLVEAYIERSGLGFTHLQPNYFMDNILVQLSSTTHTLFNRLNAPVSWIAAADIAAVAAAVLRDPAPHAGKTYPLASEAASPQDIAEMLTEITGDRHKVEISAAEKMLERLLAQGREPEYAQALLDYVDAVARGEIPEVAETFDTVEQVAGRPAIRFKDFLRHSLQT
jgi:NAD(P)H dehydrogenase (quinone)